MKKFAGKCQRKFMYILYIYMHIYRCIYIFTYIYKSKLLSTRKLNYKKYKNNI